MSANKILEGLSLLAHHRGVIEVRVPNVPDPRNPSFTATVSGYFDYEHLPEAAAQIAEKLDGRAPGIYVTANPVNPALLARAFNRLVWKAKQTTSDADILRRRWFLVDVDPVRPAGISATDAEVRAAIECRDEIVKFLTELWFPEPVCALSGNGAHAMVPMDEPNDPDTTALVQRALQALAERFSSPVVKVDASVFNAARIWKLPGTLAAKGDALPDRPHRRAAIESVPSELVPLSRQSLVELASMVKPEPVRPKWTAGSASGPGAREDLDVGEEFRQRGWYIRVGLKSGQHFVKCPFDPEVDTRKRQTQITEPLEPGGPWGFACFHSGCASRTIRDVYALLRADRPQPAEPSGTKEVAPTGPMPAGQKSNEQPKRSRALWVPKVIERYIEETQSDQLGRLPYNIPAFDAVLRGLGRGDVVAIVGSLGVGKTGFAVNLLERLTTPKRIPALMASLEMADTQVAERMASFTLGKPGREIEDLVSRRDPFVVHALTREAAEAWKHVRIIDVPLTVDALDQELTLAAEESPLRVVAVDYLGLLTTGKQDAYQEVSRVAKATKSLAKKHAVSIIMLVQTSRAGSAGKPVTISMARDSGVIGEAIDLAFGLWRPALADDASPEDKVRWEHHLIAKVLKARNAEQHQVFRMDWRPATWHIDNAVRLDPDTMEPVQLVPPGGMSSDDGLPF